MKYLITVLLIIVSFQAISSNLSRFDKLLVKSKHQKKNIQNDTSLDIPDIASSPVVQHMLKQKDSINRAKLYKPRDTSIVMSFPSSHSADEIREAEEGGLRFYQGESQREIDQRIDEYQQKELYKRIVIGIVVIVFIGGFGLYYKRRIRK